MANNSNGGKTLNCQLLTCNCEKSQIIDAKRLAKDLRLPDVPEVFTNLCRSELAAFEHAISANSSQPTIVTCTQESPLFQELADDIGERTLHFINIRETAGWSKSGARASAKIAALIAEGSYEIKPTGLIPVKSNGSCVVYGAGQQAMDVAEKLSKRLTVTLVLTQSDDAIAPLTMEFPIYQGSVTRLSGSIGKFELVLDHYAALAPSSKSVLKFQDEQHGHAMSSDLVFDLSGSDPLIGAGRKRDGYVYLEPNNPLKIAESMFDIVDLVGEFDKPIFVTYEKSACTHSRNGKTACSNCLDSCPSSAIASDGDGIIVSHSFCDGCGHCASSCPTGAISYTFPNRSDLIGRCQTLISTYLQAGGKNPVVLLHEADHGSRLISAMARFGDGLADNVLPLSVHSITHIGHEALCAFVTAGVQRVYLLVPLEKRDELITLKTQIDLTNIFLRAMQFDKGIHIQLLNEDDPDIVSTALSDIHNAAELAPVNFTAQANKRETAKLALSNLNKMAPTAASVVELPESSPYGQIIIDTERCTLCLACVSVCPANALGDHKDRPQVSFTEQACVQCGLCRVTCPENAIRLNARYNFETSARAAVTLYAEDPFECISCGKPIGSKSSIDKVIGMLQGKNPMFQTEEQVAVLKMCDDCRVIAMAKTDSNPMAHGIIPRTLTAADKDEDDES